MGRFEGHDQGRGEIVDGSSRGQGGCGHGHRGPGYRQEEGIAGGTRPRHQFGQRHPHRTDGDHTGAGVTGPVERGGTIHRPPQGHAPWRGRVQRRDSPLPRLLHRRLGYGSPPHPAIRENTQVFTPHRAPPSPMTWENPLSLVITLRDTTF